MRLLLLSFWASLCIDGGHSLQEVLSAFKLNALYLDPGKNQMETQKSHRSFSKRSLRSLVAITHDLSVNGSDENKKFGLYENSFFRFIRHSSFLKVKNKARQELLDYLEKECQ
ncbi:MAG: hypothetical protein ACO3A2_11855 [Bdellovibrionia bacterium]